MKKIIALIAAASMAACLLAACGNTAAPSETEPETGSADAAPAESETAAPAQGGTPSEGTRFGSWTVAEDTQLTPERQEVFDRALEDLVGVGYTPEAYLASQPVAGTNHCYLCRAQVVYPDAEPYYTLVFVYEDPQGGAELTGFYDLTEAASDSTAAGGWAAPESSEITDDLQEAVDKACEVYDGAEFTPVALLEEQVVAGMNYLFLCRTDPAGTDMPSYYSLVRVYANPEGGAEITEVQELHMGDLWDTATK